MLQLPPASAPTLLKARAAARPSQTRAGPTREKIQQETSTNLKQQAKHAPVAACPGLMVPKNTERADYFL